MDCVRRWLGSPRCDAMQGEWRLVWLPAVTATDGSRSLALPRDSEVFIDLDAQDWVLANDVGQTDSRRLIRLPTWGSPWKAKNGVFHLLDATYIQQSIPTATGPVTMRLVHLLVLAPLHVDSSKVSAQDADLFYSRLAMAGERWDQLHPGHPGLPASDEKPSELALIPESGAKDGGLVVRVRHYFGVAPADFPNVMNVVLHAPTGNPEHDRGNASVSTRLMNIFVNDVGPTGGGVSEEHQTQNSRFTLAHELGHVMGHPDEYFEDLETTQVEGWDQYQVDGAPARPFYNDGVGIMRSNNKPRLRSFWNYAARINAEPSFQTLTAGERFVPTNLSFPGGPLRYELPEVGPLAGGGFSTHADKNPYFPVFANIFVGTAQRATASLYRLGDDEGSVTRMFKASGGLGVALTADERMNGLLLMRVRFLFRSGSGPQAAIDRAQQYKPILNLFVENPLYNTNDYRFYRNGFLLECQPRTKTAVGQPYLKRIAAVFTPQFDYTSRHAPAIAPLGDVNIEVVSARTGPNPLTLDSPPGFLNLLESELDLSLARYALGLPTFSEDPSTHVRTVITSLAAHDMQSLANSVSGYLQTPLPYWRKASPL